MSWWEWSEAQKDEVQEAEFPEDVCKSKNRLICEKGAGISVVDELILCKSAWTS